MQRFWYHSPVRFYKTQEELTDMTNPQNTQFFGHVGNPYPLELNAYHRYLIPNYQNEVDSEELELWLVGDNDVQIPCEFGFVDGKLFRLTFISSEAVQGSFEIRESGEAIFFSNCVKFIDSTDDDGRKFIRIATKHYYSRELFSFGNGQYEWIITNLPAYCLGTFDIDEDISSSKGGNKASTAVLDSWFEENVSYEVLLNGDNNILSFLTIHSTNNEFYIDGTKRTRKEKAETEQYSPSMTMKFANQKDRFGMNIILDEKVIFEDVMRTALSNGEKTVIYIYNTNYAIPTK